MKKIAIFQTDLSVGGIQKSLVNLLNNIDYSKYKIDLYLTGEENYYNNLNKNVKVIYLKKLPYFTRFIKFNILKKFYKNKITESYDVAIDFNSYSMDTALACSSVKSNKKVIWVHNDIEIKLKYEKKYMVLYHFFKEKYKYFDIFVGVSKGAINSFKKLNDFKNKEYLVIPNFIDTNEIILKSKESCNTTVDKAKINIVSTGRICYQKGFDILINYISKLSTVRNDFHLYIIGDGDKLDNYKQLVNSLNLNNYITFLGSLKNPYNVMNLMDVFILTSRFEGQGMVFLEAKCLGLDIIMPKHLEKYVDINGTTDILKSLKEIKKNNNKKIDMLEDYNNDIINKIDDLLNR